MNRVRVTSYQYWNTEVGYCIRFRIPSSGLVDREGVTPANLNNLYGGATCQASSIADNSECNQTPV
jgi:hypothetical protein